MIISVFIKTIYIDLMAYFIKYCIFNNDFCEMLLKIVLFVVYLKYKKKLNTERNFIQKNKEYFK